MVESPVAKLTPPPKPRCQACERPLKERLAGQEDDHITNSFMCIHPTCIMTGVCLTCYMLSVWFLKQDEALSV